MPSRDQKFVGLNICCRRHHTRLLIGLVSMNNDIEGWHNRLNRQTRNGKLDLYHREADYVDVKAVLVSKDLLRLYQKRRYVDVQGRMDDYWEQYSAGDLTTSQLLRQALRHRLLRVP